MDKSTTFKDERAALKIPAPTGKTHCEHWHENNSYFGIRIMRARKSDYGASIRVITRDNQGEKFF